MTPEGLGGMVKAAAWVSNLLNLEVLSFGRAGTAPANSCRLEMTGHHLAYTVTLDGGWIFVAAAPMDQGDPPELLVTLADNAANWPTVCQLITALERSRIKSVKERPLEIGPLGPNGWVIG